MSQYLFPKYGEEYIFPLGLFASGALVAAPTLAAGDFLISKDFGTFANLTTLPTVTPAGTGQLKVTLSAAEMQAANVTVKYHDPDGTWDDGLIVIQPLQLQLKFSEYIPV